MRRFVGQSTLELTALIVIILAVLLTMGTYFKRGLSGRWKSAMDEVGDQYDPRMMNAEITHTLFSNTETRITTDPRPTQGYWTMREDESVSIDSRYGTSRVATVTAP